MNKKLIILALTLLIVAYSVASYLGIDAFQSPLVITFFGGVSFILCFPLLSKKIRWIGPYPSKVEEKKLLLQHLKDTENRFLYFRNLLSVLFFPVSIGVIGSIVNFFSQFGNGNDLEIAKNVFFILVVFAGILILGYFIYLFLSKKINDFEIERSHLFWSINVNLDESCAGYTIKQ